jgi:hypothetical protein
VTESPSHGEASPILERQETPMRADDINIDAWPRIADIIRRHGTLPELDHPIKMNETANIFN